MKTYEEATRHGELHLETPYNVQTLLDIKRIYTINDYVKLLLPGTKLEEKKVRCMQPKSSFKRISLEAVSSLFRLDGQKIKCSFQYGKMTYTEMLANYSGANVIDVTSKGTLLKQFILQKEFKLAPQTIIMTTKEVAIQQGLDVIGMIPLAGGGA